ncbi:hypothetical protein OBBRIDRAFT_792884 [Obba rivulosa]|uniref:Uncharacterized protein n=1 Tax=Obba rivulosa TaxID=1052685 RepID=A0A8E2AV37_9APHY|nr:hypothetical protein OBBRIDRAFT_792884 [Obba rivulosa]
MPASPLSMLPRRAIPLATVASSDQIECTRAHAPAANVRAPACYSDPFRINADGQIFAAFSYFGAWAVRRSVPSADVFFHCYQSDSGIRQALGFTSAALGLSRL